MKRKKIKSTIKLIFKSIDYITELSFINVIEFINIDTFNSVAYFMETYMTNIKI